MLQNQWTPKKWLINADLIKEDQKRKGMEREGRKGKEERIISREIRKLKGEFG